MGPHPRARSGIEVSEAFFVLKPGDSNHARACEVRIQDELVFAQTSIFHGVLTHLKHHPFGLQVRDQGRVLQLCVFVHGTLHQHVHAKGMGDGNDFRVRRRLQLISHISKPFEGLHIGLIKVVDHLVLCKQQSAKQARQKNQTTFYHEGKNFKWIRGSFFILLPKRVEVSVLHFLQLNAVVLKLIELVVQLGHRIFDGFDSTVKFI